MGVRIIAEPEITSLSGGEYLVTDSQTAGTNKITPQNLVESAGMGDLSDLTTTDKSSIVAAINEAASSGGGLTEEVKQALLQIAEKVAYIDDQGQTYYDALEDALYPPANLVSISAVYTQSGTVYDTDSLDSLKADLVVTANYDNGTTQTITTYTLSGTLTEGTSTITASYGGKTATFNVTVTERYALPDGYTKYDYAINTISSTKNCCVNTGIPFTYCAPEYHHIIKFRVPTYPSAESTIYGARGAQYGGTWATENLLSFGSTGILRMGFCGANNQNLYTASEDELITFEQYHQILTVNGNAVLTATGTGTYNTVVANISLFGYGWGTSTATYVKSSVQSKIYEYTIQDGSGNEVLHMIPCTNPSNVAGFYDFVSQTFKTAVTSDALTCGNDAA